MIVTFNLLLLLLFFKWILLGGPIVLTLPHMLGTEDVYRTVIGQNPDMEKHLIFADIEPVCEFKQQQIFLHFSNFQIYKNKFSA